MERGGRIAPAVALMAAAAIILTSCTTDKPKEAAKDSPYRQEGVFAGTQGVMKQVLAQTAEEKELQNAQEKLNQEAEKIKSYHQTMEAAMQAIQDDDAKALDDLQESENGKALIQMARDKAGYLYLPKGGDTGKGIGCYTFENCSCVQWYYGDYKNGKRDGSGIWYYASSHTEDGSLYKEVYEGTWSEDLPNGKGRQLIALGSKVDTDQKFKVKNGLFYGSYKIKDKLEDGTAVTGTYRLKKGKYVVISDEELTKNNFAVPTEPHLAIAFLQNAEGEIKSCTIIYAEDVTKGVKHFYE